jgi:hypothetical protein
MYKKFSQPVELKSPVSRLAFEFFGSRGKPKQIKTPGQRRRATPKRTHFAIQFSHDSASSWQQQSGEPGISRQKNSLPKETCAHGSFCITPVLLCSSPTG